MENHMELEDMRNQLASLKEKIANQEIVNDKMLRKAVAAKMTGIHRHRNKVLRLGVVALLINLPYMYYMELSPYLTIYTVFMIFFSMYATYSYHRQLENTDVYGGNMLESLKAVRMLKKKYNMSYWYSVPMVLVYLAWFIYEVSLKFDAEFTEFVIGGMLVGGLVGAVWGITMNCKLIRMCDDIIKEIEE